jgi:hypothetical protein
VDVKTETVWVLEDAHALSAGETTFLLSANGRQFAVAIGVYDGKPLMLQDMVDATRATTAHLMAMFGCALPEGTRRMEPDDLEATQPVKPS